GWGVDAQPAPGPSEAFPPDAPPTDEYGVYPEFYIPAFHFPHPVTGRPPQYPEDDPAAGKAVGFAETGETNADVNLESDVAGLESRLVAAEERVRRSLGYDAVENLLGAYAFYLDECELRDAAALFSESGEVRIADGAPQRGLERITAALEAAHCPAGRTDGAITLHHVTQPVIGLADDGATARFTARVWEVHVSSGDESFYRGGRLEGEARYGDGRWKLSGLRTLYVWTAPIVADPL